MFHASLRYFYFLASAMLLAVSYSRGTLLFLHLSAQKGCRNLNKLCLRL